jgi:hypothetical protein
LASNPLVIFTWPDETADGQILFVSLSGNIDITFAVW